MGGGASSSDRNELHAVVVPAVGSAVAVQVLELLGCGVEVDGHEVGVTLAERGSNLREREGGGGSGRCAWFRSARAVTLACLRTRAVTYMHTPLILRVPM